MKKAMKFVALALCLCTMGTFAACGGGAPEGSTEITFLYEADMYENPIFYELVKKYNDTQGKEDEVYVRASMIAGRGGERSTYEGHCEENVVMLNERSFKGIAVDNLFTDLTQYAQADNVDFSVYPEAFVNSARMTTGSNGNKTITGEGQNLLGMPFGSSPYVLFYNKDYFNKMGITVVSATEEELKTNAKYDKLMPHGYAEYTAKNGAPVEGAVVSTNLDGKSVYKIFNNKIPMNWEELRYVSKMFTKQYNSSALTTAKVGSEYGHANEWWFSFGWSVGADSIGWDGSKYNFTLMDKTPNWLATTTVSVNNKEYAAGDIISYEDKTVVGEEAMKNIDGLYQLPSAYDVQMEFLPYNVPSGKQIEKGVNGWGLASTNQERIGLFTTGTVAMMVETYMMTLRQLERAPAVKGKFDVAPQQQFRVYKDGSVYYNGQKTIGNEYLKVIGETYDNKVYTGELATENGTPIVGTNSVQNRYLYLVCPKNSDSSKYEASWKFMKWAAGIEGQKILAKTTNITPAHTTAAFDDFVKQKPELNNWAVANASANGSIPDWAYFESGEWVTEWSSDYNDSLRYGTMTIQEFLDNNYTAANAACAKAKIIIKGRK